MTTPKLKPCPFCGGEAKLEHYEGDGYLPMCSVEGCCGMVEIWFDTPEKATEAWNRRTFEPLVNISEEVRRVKNAN